jgi:hypothetical protein
VASQAEVVQAVVFATVTWVIAGTLSGLHYWLIRRDIQNHPDAAVGAIRSFFLNITEAVAITAAVPLIGFAVLNSLAFSTEADVASPLASAISALGLFVLLELERRRTQVHSGAALAFQRFHFYAMQTLLLFYFTSACFMVIRPLVGGVFLGDNVEQCRIYDGSACSQANLFYLIATLLWFVACWIWYGWLLGNDKMRMLRLILHNASFLYGVGFVLAGINVGIQLLLSLLFKLPITLQDVLGRWSAQYDFFSPLFLGLVVVGVYHLWLRKAVQQGLIDRSVQFLMAAAIIEVLSAASFWWGCGYLLYNLFQMLEPAPNAPDLKSWIVAIAFVIAGLAYIPLDIYLHRRSMRDASIASGPRRGVVLALLGGGTLALAIGGATALYAWMTAMFGSAITNWQQVAHIGTATFLVGIILAGMSLWFALREHLFSAHDKQAITPVTSPAKPEPAVEPPASFATVEDVLDALLASKLTRDEAIERIRMLSNAQ